MIGHQLPRGRSPTTAWRVPQGLLGELGERREVFGSVRPGRKPEPKTTRASSNVRCFFNGPHWRRSVPERCLRDFSGSNPISAKGRRCNACERRDIDRYPPALVQSRRTMASSGPNPADITPNLTESGPNSAGICITLLDVGQLLALVQVAPHWPTRGNVMQIPAEFEADSGKVRPDIRRVLAGLDKLWCEFGRVWLVSATFSLKPCGEVLTRALAKHGPVLDEFAQFCPDFAQFCPDFLEHAMQQSGPTVATERFSERRLASQAYYFQRVDEIHLADRNLPGNVSRPVRSATLPNKVCFPARERQVPQPGWRECK